MNRSPGRQATPWWIAAAAAALVVSTAPADEARTLREQLVASIAVDVEDLLREPLDDRTRSAMLTVPRHRFVPGVGLRTAYGDHPVPIGHGQTISQPFIVALMTHLLDVGPDDRVLEIGTGSAYQAAVLAEIVDRVYTIEIIEPLGREAASRLDRLGYDNVETRIGDGYFGWEEAEPFDAIIVTAAASHVPPPLVKQLEPGGRMLIPVGPPMFTQHLMLVEKDAEGEVSSRQILAVRFVPLTGDRSEP